MGRTASKAAIVRKMMGGKPGAFLFGTRQVGLSRAEAMKNIVYGTDADRDDRWPVGYTESNPLASEVVKATKEAN